VQLEQVRPSVLRLTLHAYELAALIAAARLVAQKGEEELPEEAAQQLRQVLASYDEASHHPPTREHPLQRGRG
jgi:predicted DNA-binding transcriptional regulator YafY